MKHKKQSLKVLNTQLQKGLVTIVFMMGALVSTNILLNPIPTSIIQEKSEGLRGPASVTLVTDHPVPQEEIPVVETHCGPRIEQKVATKMFRLRGPACAELTGELQLTNDKNEIVATVFTNEQGYNTDIIHLPKGSATFYLKSETTHQSQVIEIVR